MIKRIFEAIEKIEIGDFENALIQISIGIDGVAKIKYPELNTTKRCIKLIDDYRHFIYKFSTLGQVTIRENGNVLYAGEFKGKTLGEIIYKVIRCGLLHDGKLPDNNSFVFGGGLGIGAFKFGDPDPKFGFLISKGFLLSICLVIIENDTSEDYNELLGYKEFLFNERKLRIDKSLWGYDNLTQKILEDLNM